MTTRRSPGTLESEQGQLLLAVCAALLLCWLFFDSFVFGTCWLLHAQWAPLTFVPRLQYWALSKTTLLEATLNAADDVSFGEWLVVMNATSGVLLVWTAPMVGVSAFALSRHPGLAFRSKRPINIHTLPALLSRFAPAVVPVLAMNPGKDGLMNDTRPENAPAQWPEEFVAWHNLVTRRVLDREAARAVFAAQLGEPLWAAENGRVLAPTQWAPHERALLAVFGLQVFLNDRPAALALLDALNRSCLVKGMLRRRAAPLPLYRLSDAAVARVIASPALQDWLAMHHTVRSALAGLYGRDLRLPPVKFRWLKGVDRALWYALHSADTAKAFVEGAGILAQARAERHAAKLGLPRPGVMVDAAVDGLQADLEALDEVHARAERGVATKHPPPQPLMEAAYGVNDGEEEE